MAGELQKIESNLAELRADRNNKQERRGEILDNYGTRDRLEEHIDACERELQNLTDDKQELRELVDDKIEPTRAELERAKNERENLQEALEESQHRIEKLEVEIQTLTGSGAKRKLDDLRAELETKKDRRDELQKRAEAAQLLWQLVEAHRDERNRQLAGPIRGIVDDWLQRLTDRRHEHLDIDETLTPDGVQPANYEEALPFSELSYGTREQTHVLLRLALAELLGEKEPHTVILDDRLLNSDPRRHRIMNGILEEVAEDCQILLATCNDTPYAGLDANEIRVPREGRTDEAA